MATLIHSLNGSTSSSLILLRTGAEVSGHIDLCQRFQNENLLSYLSGAKRLVPKMRDLTFYNWAIGRQLRPVEIEKTPSDSSFDIQARRTSDRRPTSRWSSRRRRGSS